MERILVVMCAVSWQDAAPAMYDAKSAANAPEKLSFGLMLEEPLAQENLAEFYALGSAQWAQGDMTTWQAVNVLWQGETYVLAAQPDMLFDRDWDRHLLDMLAYCRSQGHAQCALTGYPPCEEDVVDAMAPVAVRLLDIRRIIYYHPGTPLRYALHPIRSAFYNPQFCFAPAGLFREAQRWKPPYFLAAYQHRWHFYTPNRPVIRTTSPMWISADVVRHVTEEEASSFETRFSISLTKPEASPMARCGIFEPDLVPPTRIPLRVKVQEALRGLRSNKSSPLCVTAWLKLPEVPLDDTRMVPFRRLCAMKNLPLLCFADHESAPRILLSHPNVLEFKRRYGLSVPDEALTARNLSEYVHLCKAFLLAQAREKFMTHSHYIWMDFDYLTYPVYERSSLAWDAICGDRITVAMVDGQVDTSMVVVPEERIEPLCREIAARCAMSLKNSIFLPVETVLWGELCHDHPDWFQTIPRPRTGQLLSLALTPRGVEWGTKA